MIAVIFELTPNPGRRQDYLGMAAGLRPLLAEVEGFISIERFESLSDCGKLLSLSFWRDEAAVTRGGTWKRTAPPRLRAGRACWRITGCGWRRSCGTMECRSGMRRRRIPGPQTAEPQAAGGVG